MPFYKMIIEFQMNLKKSKHSNKKKTFNTPRDEIYFYSHDNFLHFQPGVKSHLGISPRVELTPG